jgi:hypothetical protein
LFWECGHLLTNETEPDGLADTIDIGTPHLGATIFKKYMADHRKLSVHDPEELYQRWVRFRMFYTACNLTKGDDVLPAIHGIAQDVAEAMQDEMVVGLWKGRLIQELCWNVSYVSSPRPRPSLEVPSWSWISTSRAVYGGEIFLRDAHMLATVQEVLLDKCQIGNMGPTSLVLRCRLIPASFRPTYHGDPNIWSTTDELSHCGITIDLDDDDPRMYKAHAAENCYLLILRYRKMPDDWYLPCRAEGIVIVLHDMRSSSYRRTGYWKTDMMDSKQFSDRLDILTIHQSAAEQVIKLV